MTEANLNETNAELEKYDSYYKGFYPVYWFLRCALRVVFLLGWRWRRIGLENMPKEGPVLVVSNHASFLDPMLLGTCFDRPIGYMARRTLFRGLFGWAIAKLYAFPLERDGDPRSALRAMGRRLRQNLCVTMFPEGTRTRTGRIGSIKRGVGMISVRNATPVLPVYIGGAFDSWPRTRLVPLPYPLRLEIGEPIVPRDCGDDRVALREEEKRVQQEVEKSLRAMEARYFELRGLPLSEA